MRETERGRGRQTSHWQAWAARQARQVGRGRPTGQTSRGQITQKCGSGRVGMRETHRETRVGMRQRHRQRQACRHAGRVQSTHKCGSRRAGMRETERGRGRQTSHWQAWAARQARQGPTDRPDKQGPNYTEMCLRASWDERDTQRETGMQARRQGSNYTEMWLRASWDERERHRERQACRHAGRGKITHKCGSGRVGMRETERGRGRQPSHW